MGKRKGESTSTVVSELEAVTEVEKVPITTTTATDKDTPAKKKSKKKKSKKAKSLFELVKEGSTIPVTRDDWYKSYSKDNNQALTDLINFLIESSGCRSLRSATEIKNEEVPALMKKILTTDYLHESDSDYPVISRKAEFKGFHENFSHFWKSLISKCPNQILFDNFFMSGLSSWISNFTNSSARPFRHTATIAGLAVINGLIKVATRTLHNLAPKQKQLDIEKKKATSSSSKVQQISAAASNYQERVAQLEEMMDEFFLGRYRDTVAEIRVECMLALGNWIHDYPRHFLEDEYLKYFGWIFNDKSPEVRKSALVALQNLYENTEHQAQLENFTHRFKDRIVEMTTDKDNSVCVEAIKLASLLATEFLEDEDKENVCQLITNENASVRAEAASFVKKTVFDEKKKKKSSAETELIAFLDLINDSKIPDLPNYITDAMWSSMPVLKDWETMTSMLLKDDSLEERKQILLVRLINVCIKKACGKPVCPKTRPETEKLPKKATLQSNQEALTKHFIKALPQLLEKYQGEKDKVEELAEIPQLLLLELFKAKYFKELVLLLSDIYSKATDDSVLSGIAKTFKYFSSEEYAFKDAFETEYQKLLKALDKKLQEGIDNEQEAEQIASLKRINNLYSVLNLKNIKLYARVSPLIAEDSKATVHAMSFVYYHLIWEFASLDPTNSDAIDELQSKLSTFKDQLQKLLGSKKEAVQRKAFFVLADLMFVFHNKMRGTSLENLAFVAPHGLQDAIAKHIEKQLSSGDDEEKEKIVASAARLVAFGSVMASIVGPAVVKMFTESTLLGDLIKSMFTKLRESNPVEEGKLLHFSLRKQFEDAPENLKQLSELAQSLAAMYTFHVNGAEVGTLGKFLDETIAYFGDQSAERTKFLAIVLLPFTAKFTAEQASAAATKIEGLSADIDPEDDENKSFFDTVAHLKAIGSAGTPGAKKGKPRAKVARDLAKELDSESDAKPKPKSKKPKKKSPKRKSVETSDTSNNEVEDIQEFSQEETNKKTKKQKTKSLYLSEEDDEEELLGTKLIDKRSKK